MAKLTLGPEWFGRVDDEGQPLVGPPWLPLSPESRKELVLALSERAKADPRVLFQQKFEWRRWWVYLRFGQVAGRIECIGIEVMGNPDLKDQAPVTALALRGLPFGKLVDRARREYREGLQTASGIDPDGGSWSPELTEIGRASCRERV